MNTEVLISFIVASIALTLSPGPDIIYVLLQSIANGKKYGIVTALGLVSGIIIHTTLVAFGVSAIIKQSDSVFFIIKLLGALYLFYLAFKVFKASSNIEISSETVPRKKLMALYRQGFIMNVLNPKVTIFFLAFFPGFLFSDALVNEVQFFVLGFLFMIQALLIFSLVSVLAGKIATYLKEHKRFGIWMKWLQIAVFVGIGIFILLSEK